MRRFFRRTRKEAVPPVFFAESGQDYSRDLNFTRNQTVFRVTVVVNNELLRDLSDEAVEPMLTDLFQRRAGLLAQKFLREKA